ncbi:MAG: ABC transporter substrate-binding protein, partial [Spirochaetota bacterium]
EWRYNGQTDTYEFDLRSGVRFHDNRQLATNDVVTTLRTILDPRTSVGDSFFSDYVDTVSAVGSKINIKLKRTPWNKLQLFTFGVVQDVQLGETVKKGFSKQTLGPGWNGLKIISTPQGTGPFKLVNPVPTGRITDLALVRFSDYFESKLPGAIVGNIQEIDYLSYETSGLQTMMEDIQNNRFDIAVQQFKLDTNDFNVVEYGNDSIYYLGFNFRGDRNVNVCTTPSSGRGREYKPTNLRFADLLNAKDVVDGYSMGRSFRRFMMEGIDRDALLRIVTMNATMKTDKLVQRSIFPAGPFAERKGVADAAIEHLPSTTSSQGADQLNAILSNKKLPESFKLINRDELKNFMDATGINASKGLFGLNGQKNRYLSLKLIYSQGDRFWINSTVITTFLVDSFLQMGIVLQLYPVDRFNFASEVEKGDWDLILTSYDVPADYNVSRTFAQAGLHNQNVMSFSTPGIESIVSEIGKATVEYDYAARLEALNRELMKELPAVFLFGLEYSAGIRKTVLDNKGTPIEELRHMVDSQYFFGQVDKWRMSN